MHRQALNCKAEQAQSSLQRNKSCRYLHHSSCIDVCVPEANSRNKLTTEQQFWSYVKFSKVHSQDTAHLKSLWPVSCPIRNLQHSSFRIQRTGRVNLVEDPTSIHQYLPYVIMVPPVGEAQDPHISTVRKVSKEHFCSQV